MYKIVTPIANIMVSTFMLQMSFDKVISVNSKLPFFKDLPTFRTATLRRPCLLRGVAICVMKRVHVGCRARVMKHLYS